MAPTTKATTLSALKKSREIYAAGPSGHVYKVRPMNMERFALSGGLPTKLRDLAMKGSEAVNEALQSDAMLDEGGADIRDYLDTLIRKVVVEPSLEDVDDLDVLPPVDYRWLIGIAMGDTDRDGEGRRLWGNEPLTLWSTFRTEHDCAEDCPKCDRLRASVADLQ